MTDADYADDLLIFSVSINIATKPLQSLEEATINSHWSVC